MPTLPSEQIAGNEPWTLSVTQVTPLRADLPTIQAAHVIESLRALRQIRQAIEAIHHDLLSLGREGLHDVLHHYGRRGREAEAARRRRKRLAKRRERARLKGAR